MVMMPLPAAPIQGDRRRRVDGRRYPARVGPPWMLSNKYPGFMSIKKQQVKKKLLIVTTQYSMITSKINSSAGTVETVDKYQSQN